MAKKIVSVRLSPAAIDAADRAATRAGVSRSEWVGRVIARDALIAAGRPVDGTVETVDR